MTLNDLKAKYADTFVFAQINPTKLDVFCRTHGDNIHHTSYKDSSGQWGETKVEEIEKALLDHLE